MISFTAYGKPEPQGSTKAFYVKSLGRAVITSTNPKNKSWRKTVGQAAQAAIGPGFTLWTGPVAVDLMFYLPRPQSIRKREPPHITRPDIDKLTRSVFDSLTGVIWRDDGQVVQVSASKAFAPFGSEARAVVQVRPYSTTDVSDPIKTSALLG
jgi:crossover junction endodeoxyribonuclease RusA